MLAMKTEELSELVRLTPQVGHIHAQSNVDCVFTLLVITLLLWIMNDFKNFSNRVESCNSGCLKEL